MVTMKTLVRLAANVAALSFFTAALSMRDHGDIYWSVLPLAIAAAMLTVAMSE